MEKRGVPPPSDSQMRWWQSNMTSCGRSRPMSLCNHTITHTVMSSPNACSPRVASMRSPRAEGDDLESPSASPSGREYTSLASLMQQDREPSLPTLPQARNKRDRHVGWRIDLPEPASQVGQKKDKARLSFWQLIALTMSMGGSQVSRAKSKLTRRSHGPCMSIVESTSDDSELGYGTPYLLELGLSEQLTSLVWLAGPISGLVVQPLIGAISDSSASHYRRRFWVVASTVLLVLSGLGLAFTDPVARAIVALIGGGQGDWDPKNAEMVRLSQKQLTLGQKHVHPHCCVLLLLPRLCSQRVWNPCNFQLTADSRRLCATLHSTSRPRSNSILPTPGTDASDTLATL